MYSCYDNGQYGIMSGTSMSSPQLAGAAALVLQYLGECYPDLADAEERDIAHALLMSTAVPVISSASNVEASPRQQGAGLVDAAAAVTAEAYLSVPGEDRPKAELGDDPGKDGTFSFFFDIRNISDEAQTYELDFSLLTEDLVDYDFIAFMAGFDRELSGDVVFDQDTVTVEPNSSARVEATIRLSEEDMAWMDKYYTNGIFVEGYVYAKNTAGTGVDLSLPFLGFYGDWTAAPIMDEGYWFETAFWDPNAMPTANQYFHTVWTDLAGMDFVLGFNPYTGMLVDENGNIYYDPANNVISPNGDGALDNIPEIYVSLMRSAKTLSFTFSDAETGEVYFEAADSYARKTSYSAMYGQIVPYLYTWYHEPWNFTDANGKALPNGTKLNLTVAATGDYDVHTEDLNGDSFVIPITVDTAAPELLAMEPVSTANGNFLKLTVSENVNLADVFVMNTTNTRILAEMPFSQKNEDGTYTVELDITGLGTEFLVILCDYGANESAYTVTFEGDDNLPELADGTVYGYRVMDASYTDDTLYGWVAIDPETAEVTTLTSDYMEMYALTAAEYAGGYVFAVDAGYNLVAMVPGLWNRMEVCNLGFSVADMTFDASTNTMYMVGKLDYQTVLLKLDLTTGAYEEVCGLGTGSVYSIECTDSGELYAIKGGSAKLWKMNWETMELESVMDFTTGEYPYYSQSMTYDAENNCLYWAYCTYMASGHAIYTVDLDTLTYTKADFATMSEYVGLLMIDDTADLPECDENNCPSKDFVDVENPSWYHEGVDFVVGNGYMDGISATEFAPAMAVNRAMVITVLYRVAGEPEITGSHAFADVEAGSFYENAVIWGVENAIVNGKSADSFAPGDAVTREELVTFLYRFAKYMGCDVNSRSDALVDFVDTDSLSAYAVVPMKWAVGSGLISGMDATHLGARALSNRAQLAVILARLYIHVMGGFRLPAGELAGLKLAPESVLLPVGGAQTLTVTPDPWNAKLGDIAFASTDESVATVSADGVITGVAGGECEIVAVCGELSASVSVRIVDVQGTVSAYNYFSNTMEYGSWITMDLSDLSSVTYGEMSPVDFIAADYNGHADVIYGYDSNYTFYAWDQKTGDVTVIGSAGNQYQITDLAYDYSSGIMYGVGVDVNTYAGVMFQVDVRTGKLVNVAMSMNYLAYFGLAIDLQGNAYVLDSESNLHSVSIVEDIDWMTGEPVRYAAEELILSTGFGGLNYTQSMCYDHENDQIIWAACGAYSTIFWMDPATGDYLELGGPEGEVFFEFMGMHSVPTEIPELPVVALESADLPESMAVMVGGAKAAPLSINPLNATIDAIEWTSSDESVATVDENGTVTGVAKGEATISVMIHVTDSEPVMDTMTVTVMESADNIYSFILTDFATMNGLVWAEIPDTAPETPNYLMGTEWTIEAAEYYDGYIYAYGYDSYSWEDTSRYLFTIDPETFEIVEAINTGMELFVYDMSFDYSTGTMYALASYNNDGGADLYMVDLNSGKLILSATMDKFFMAIAFNEEGTLYAIDESTMEEDFLTGEVTVSDAGLYTIDPATGAYELVGSTGLKNNMYCSMAFDFDTGNLYWNTCYRMDFWSPVEAKFCVIDSETGAATDLGFLGAAGSQVSALLTIADEYPEVPEAKLSAVVIDEKLHTLSVGDTAEVDPLVIHPNCAAELSYASSDEAVATVDENGVITAVAPGTAEITVTATQGDLTASASCKVVVFAEDATMMAFETRTNTWSSIGRMDVSAVESVTEEQDAVLAAAYMGDIIYGYDAQHNFFSMDPETYERTVIGNAGLGMVPTGEIGVDYLDIRGMAYHPTFDCLLVLGAVCCPNDGWIDEYVGSTTIFMVDVTSGMLMGMVALHPDLTNVRGMAVDGEGNVYVYSAFDDYFSVVDLASGMYTHKCSLQSLGVYGSSEHNMPMAYDAETGLVYCLFTSNGSFHKMLTFNPLTAQVKDLGNVGEVIENEDTWTYEGPTFSALLIK
ncbi:MAG: Ig-like domain-containing protein [Oscillospiraceae bacterium]|nr:Ig-like domain-containing protein [Oscillospiraceae bacterium]